MPPFAISAQTMRAFLLASATATTSFGFLASMRASQEPAGAPLRVAQRTGATAPQLKRRAQFEWSHFRLADSSAPLYSDVDELDDLPKRKRPTARNRRSCAPSARSKGLSCATVKRSSHIDHAERVRTPLSCSARASLVS